MIRIHSLAVRHHAFEISQHALPSIPLHVFSEPVSEDVGASLPKALSKSSSLAAARSFAARITTSSEVLGGWKRREADVESDVNNRSRHSASARRLGGAADVEPVYSWLVRESVSNVFALGRRLGVLR
jgi:hypothetical protein